MVQRGLSPNARLNHATPADIAEAYNVPKSLGQRSAILRQPLTTRKREVKCVLGSRALARGRSRAHVVRTARDGKRERCSVCNATAYGNSVAIYIFQTRAGREAACVLQCRLARRARGASRRGGLEVLG